MFWKNSQLRMVSLRSLGFRVLRIHVWELDRFRGLPSCLLRGHSTYAFHLDSSLKKQVSPSDVIALSAKMRLQDSGKPSHEQQLFNGWGAHLPAATGRAVRAGLYQLQRCELSSYRPSLSHTYILPGGKSTLWPRQRRVTSVLQLQRSTIRNTRPQLGKGGMKTSSFQISPAKQPFQRLFCIHSEAVEGKMVL